jgi:hypothetical protein
MWTGFQRMGLREGVTFIARLNWCFEFVRIECGIESLWKMDVMEQLRIVWCFSFYLASSWASYTGYSNLIFRIREAITSFLTI